MQVVLTPECALALASLVGRSAKYPLLVNEGVVALSLMSTLKAGGKFDSPFLPKIRTQFALQAPLLLPRSSLPYHSIRRQLSHRQPRRQQAVSLRRAAM
jgi:predicted alpha/beta-hydrolase family hydrolase